jgi:hypothetical protein
MDCVLEKTKESVLAENVARKKTGINPEPFLLREANDDGHVELELMMENVGATRHHACGPSLFGPDEQVEGGKPRGGAWTMARMENKKTISLTRNTSMMW